MATVPPNTVSYLIRLDGRHMQRGNVRDNSREMPRQCVVSGSCRRDLWDEAETGNRDQRSLRARFSPRSLSVGTRELLTDSVSILFLSEGVE